LKLQTKGTTMTLFRLDASIRTEGSASRELADRVQDAWQAAHPHEPVVRREIGTQVLPADAWPLAVGASMTPLHLRTDEQEAASALARQLVDELDRADALLFAVPLYNFGVSQHFKAYIDLVLTDPRCQPGSDDLLAGKPAVLTTVRGGAYGPGTPRAGWDHSTDYLRRILTDKMGTELRVVEREFTLVGVNPALDAFTDVAAELHSQALQDATDAGTWLAGKVSRPAAA
jgi:FMN-dependent NADH-azoreductase